jgi:hypothetical protein
VPLDPTFVGLEQFATSAGLVSQMAAEGRAPEAIVLGVDYRDPYTRLRDYVAPEPIDPAFGGDGAGGHRTGHCKSHYSHYVATP